MPVESVIPEACVIDMLRGRAVCPNGSRMLKLMDKMKGSLETRIGGKKKTRHQPRGVMLTLHITEPMFCYRLRAIFGSCRWQPSPTSGVQLCLGDLCAGSVCLARAALRGGAG